MTDVIVSDLALTERLQHLGGASASNSSLAIPLRSPDAHHLATALDAEAATTVSFDPRLRDAAASQGLFVVPPSI